MFATLFYPTPFHLFYLFHLFIDYIFQLTATFYFFFFFFFTVCKEWLVREDGALAYKLQSQESESISTIKFIRTPLQIYIFLGFCFIVNDFYKGNRTRNAVVREDFPTALQEQIKEKETAEKQAEAYRRRLREQ